MCFAGSFASRVGPRALLDSLVGYLNIGMHNMKLPRLWLFHRYTLASNGFLWGDQAFSGFFVNG